MQRRLSSLIAELKVCSISRNLERGRRVHEAAVKSGDHAHVCVANTLINMYAKCGLVEEARRIFEGMDNRTVVSWNALLLGYVENGESEVALYLFSRMEQQGCSPDERSFLAAIKASAEIAAMERGSAAYFLACCDGCDSDTYLANAVVNMYVKCGYTDLARGYFESMESRTVVSWTSLMLGYAENGKGEEALHLFCRMGSEGCVPDTRVFVAALKACSDLATFEEHFVKCQGRALHMLAVKYGCDCDVFVENTLVDMYAKLGSMYFSRTVFENMRTRDVISWTNLIMGYAENGEAETSLNLLSRMGRQGFVPDARTFVAAIKARTELSEEENSLKQGKALHLLAFINHCDNNYVKNTLVGMYGKCGSMPDAHAVFDNIEHRDVVSWTSLVLGYTENGESEVALRMFSTMEPHCTPDSRIFVAALKACSDLAVAANNSKLRRIAAERLKAIHLIVTLSGCDSDVYVASSLVDIYSKCKGMPEARMVFDGLIHHDLVSWTALILGYAENGEPEEALNLFSKMYSENCAPTSLILFALLKSCTDLEGNGLLDKEELKKRGSSIHILASSVGCDANVYLRNILVEMYTKCKCMDDARKVFDDMENRDVVCWTALMLGYAENGQASLVLDLFPRMKREGCEPDPVTFIPVLKACSMLGAAEYGKAVHREILDRSFETEPIISAVLVDFYSRCGSLTEAEDVFLACQTRDLVAWNALMAGYSRYGDVTGVFGVFDRMVDSGAKPNGVTFVYVLAACSHAGLVKNGKDYFESMASKHEVEPDVEHYVCMVDLLGRANKLEEAMFFVRSMVFTPDVVTWTIILGSCRKWKNVDLGRLAFESVISLDETSGGAYAQMGSIYGENKQLLWNM